MDSVAFRQWPENMILSRPPTAREGKIKRQYLQKNDTGRYVITP